MPKIKLIVDGGAMKPGPAIAQQLGPMGINIGKVIDDVNKATIEFKGMRVPVELDVEQKTKSYKIEVLSPPVAEIIKKELGLEAGSGEAGKIRAGNIAFETIIKIAKMKSPSLPTRSLTAAIKLVVGSCISIGILIDNKDPKVINQDIEEGKYDNEIKQEITEPTEEKKKELSEYFMKVKEFQEKAKKAAEEAAAAAEAAKAAAATAAGVAAAPGAAPTAGATTATATGVASAPAEAKKEEKPKKKELKKK